MSIWFNKEVSLNALQEWSKNTMSDHLQIHFREIGPDFLMATMPVNQRTQQPYGLLHGGASAALAETLGSVASALVIDTENFICVGVEINANHVKGVRNGFVTGTCTPLHLGSTTHVWNIRIENENGQLVCISRLTVAVLKKKTG